MRKKYLYVIPVKVNSWMIHFFKKIFFIIFLKPKDQPSLSKKTHLTYVILFAMLILLPFLFSFQKGEVNKVTFFKFKIPSPCITKNVFKRDCPGCGLTRSFVKIAQGEFREAFRFNRISILLYIFFISAMAFHAYCLYKLPNPIPEKLGRTKRIFSNLMIFFILANWLLGFYLGSNGGLN